MRITKKQLRYIIRESLKASHHIKKEDDDLEEQDAVAGYMVPLGYDGSKERRKKRKEATKANASAFGGGKEYRE